MKGWALVTGAARRLGRDIALALADAGWGIVIHYHQSGDEAEKLADELRARGAEACLAEIDLGKAALARNLIPSLVSAIGPLGVLVNNASLFEPDRMDPDGRRHHAINLEAPRLLCDAFREQMPQDHPGVIVNLLDADPTKPEFLGYNKSKVALGALTKDLALRYAPGIRVNGVALGPVLPSSRESQEHFKNLVQATPLAVQVTPQAVALSVRFLIENSFVTGEILHVDSGAHLKRAERNV